MNNSEKFKKVFGIYAEEFWAKPEKEMLDWIAEETKSDRKKGKWIFHIDDLFPEESTQECSVCHEEESIKIQNDNFCPNCGAEMRMRGV